MTTMPLFILVLSLLLYLAPLCADGQRTSDASFLQSSNATFKNATITKDIDKDEYMRIRKQFARFVEQFDKVYETEEVFRRFNVYRDNLAFVEKHNTRDDVSYSVEMNEFSDLTFDEFKTRNGFHYEKHLQSKYLHTQNTVQLSMPLPESGELDWTEKGAVTPGTYTFIHVPIHLYACIYIYRFIFALCEHEYARAVSSEVYILDIHKCIVLTYSLILIRLYAHSYVHTHINPIYTSQSRTKDSVALVGRFLPPVL